MQDGRPNPDELLAQVTREEKKSSQGKLKIFLGYSAGVGKTYTMLEEAQSQKEHGKDIVVACVESHGRKETEELLVGLESLPQKEIEYRGVRLKEMDLDKVLARRPQLALVDELAHTNAPGSRHTKRYQDVKEMLEAGIDVYTTLNIQHLESMNDAVAQVSGIKVRETIPDSVLAEANEIKWPRSQASKSGRPFLIQSSPRRMRSRSSTFLQTSSSSVSKRGKCMFLTRPRLPSRTSSTKAT